MGERRKPDLIVLLRKPGKRKAGKLELFDSELWPDGKRWKFGSRAKRFRIRVNGKWNDKMQEGNKKYFTKWEFRDLLWRSIKW